MRGVGVGCVTHHRPLQSTQGIPHAPRKKGAPPGATGHRPRVPGPAPALVAAFDGAPAGALPVSSPRSAAPLFNAAASALIAASTIAASSSPDSALTRPPSPSPAPACPSPAPPCPCPCLGPSPAPPSPAPPSPACCLAPWLGSPLDAASDSSELSVRDISGSLPDLESNAADGDALGPAPPLPPAAWALSRPDASSASNISPGAWRGRRGRSDRAGLGSAAAASSSNAAPSIAPPAALRLRCPSCPACFCLRASADPGAPAPSRCVAARLRDPATLGVVDKVSSAASAALAAPPPPPLPPSTPVPLPPDGVLSDPPAPSSCDVSRSHDLLPRLRLEPHVAMPGSSLAPLAWVSRRRFRVSVSPSAGTSFRFLALRRIPPLAPTPATLSATAPSAPALPAAALSVPGPFATSDPCAPTPSASATPGDSATSAAFALSAALRFRCARARSAFACAALSSAWRLCRASSNIRASSRAAGVAGWTAAAADCPGARAGRAEVNGQAGRAGWGAKCGAEGTAAGWRGVRAGRAELYGQAGRAVGIGVGCVARGVRSAAQAA